MWAQAEHDSWVEWALTNRPDWDAPTMYSDFTMTDEEVRLHTSRMAWSEDAPDFEARSFGAHVDRLDYSHLMVEGLRAEARRRVCDAYLVCIHRRLKN